MKLVCPTCHSRFDKPTTMTGAPILCPICGRKVNESVKISSSDRPAVGSDKPEESLAGTHPGTLLPVQPMPPAVTAPTGVAPVNVGIEPDIAGETRYSGSPSQGDEDLEEIGQSQGIPTPASVGAESNGDLKPGNVLGGCEIIEKIASGGMGAVYRARHLRLDREVALKVLPEELASKGGPNVRLRFFNEAQVAAQIDHPNVVQVFDVGQEQGQFYIIFQYVKGTTLEDLVSSKGPMEHTDALNAILRAADGLQAAHKKGLIHRDVKPSNIMLSEDGRIKITDFGLARFEDISCELNTFGHILGTPSYMSPEQCDGKEMDHRSDIYSLGCTLYYLLTGTHPFVADNTLAIMRMHREAMPRPAHEVNPKIPPEVWPLVERTMAKRPEDRYPSLVEFMADVEDLLAGKPPGYASAWRPVTAPPPGPEPIRPLPEMLPAQAHSSGILGGRRTALIPIAGGEIRRKAGGTLLKRLASQSPARSPAEPIVSAAEDGGTAPARREMPFGQEADGGAGPAQQPKAAGEVRAHTAGEPIPAKPAPQSLAGGKAAGVPAEAAAGSEPTVPPTAPAAALPSLRPLGPIGTAAGAADGVAKDMACDPLPAVPRPSPLPSSPITTSRRPSGPLIGWGPSSGGSGGACANASGKDQPKSAPPAPSRGTRITPAAGTQAAGIAYARRGDKTSGYNPWTVERDNYAERIARKRQALAGKVFDTRCSKCGHVFEAPGSMAYGSRECPNCGALTICEPIESKDGERKAPDEDWKRYAIKVVKVCVFLLTAIAFVLLAYGVYWFAYGWREESAASLAGTADRYYKLLSLRDYQTMYRIESAGADGIVPETGYVEYMKKTYSLINVKDRIIGPPVLSEDGKFAKVRIRLQMEGVFAGDMKSSFTTSWVRRGDAWLKLPSKSLCLALGVSPPSALDPDSE